MLCDICHKNIATVHLTEIINNKITELHICGACAKAKTEELKEHLDISAIIGGLVKAGEREGKSDIALKCSFCGLTYKEFKNKGRLGCGGCYEAFKSQLIPLLRKIHGAYQHTGKYPHYQKDKVPKELTIKKLKERLERAVKLEEYELAAQLRDEIRNLEKES